MDFIELSGGILIAKSIIKDASINNRQASSQVSKRLEP